MGELLHILLEKRLTIVFSHLGALFDLMWKNAKNASFAFDYEFLCAIFMLQSKPIHSVVYRDQFISQ